MREIEERERKEGGSRGKGKRKEVNRREREVTHKEIKQERRVEEGRGWERGETYIL